MGKKAGRRGDEDGALSITSMMDMMTIILVFLLKSYSTSDVSIKPTDDLQIPLSTSKKPPALAVNVVVSRSKIVVDGIPVLNLDLVADEETGDQIIAVPESEKKGQMISSLYDVMLEKAETAKEIGQRATAAGASADAEFKGQVLLQCDKNLPFAVVREVMYTAGQAQFGEFKFVVIKNSG